MKSKEQSTNMLSRFSVFVEQEQLWQPEDRLLIALSGGLDSVVLTHLAVGLGTQCALAHCNFGLRGEESLRDEEFCAAFARERGLQLFNKRFDTYGFAYQQGISVEMAARELRYAWFSELIATHGFKGILTGHHADDQVETMLLNLIRGTGISGLRGMLPLAGQVIRPMLPFFREEILQFAAGAGLRWVEDSTNASVEIKRNKIRHAIIPALESLNPAFRDVALRTISNVRQAELIYQQKIEEVMEPLLSGNPDMIRISITGLMKLPYRQVFLYEYLSGFGFNRAVADAVNRSLEGISGKRFSSASHRLVRDRAYLIITPVRPDEDEEEGWQYLINRDETLLRSPLSMSVSRLPADGYSLQDERAIAALDLDRLSFPLTLRKWQHGDTFQPLGMNNKRKLSDFFTDLKLSLPEKENTWVVLSDEKIVWVVGYRIDHRFRITRSTKRVFEMKLNRHTAG
ncbi:MAG: tRNA lysidine(34) synthetase TilS [Bacteroidales bacterium]